MSQYIHRTLAFLSRMSTAVGVLAILAVFSVVGTLIPQSRSPQFYDATYGPDGADLIHLLGLDNVYSAWWFLAMAAFLVLSVSVCLTRNGPRLWRNMRAPKKVPSLGVLRQWTLTHTSKQDGAKVVNSLQKQGFTIKRSYPDGSTMLIKGTGGRLGYFFTHLAVIFLCLAALITGVWGYRLTLHLTEGQSLNYAALWKDGQFNVFDLPFTLTNNDVEVEHYFTGKPSQFVTKLAVTHEGETTEHTISVNKPLNIAGHRIYQADYGDGGSPVSFKLRSMQTGELGTYTYDGRTGYDENALTGYDGAKIIPEVLNPYTIITNPDSDRGQETENLGVSVDIQLQTPTQSALRLKVFKDSPWLVGVSSAADEEHNIQFIGLNIAKDEGWGLAARLLSMLPKPYPQDPDALQSMLMDNMKKIAVEELAGLPEEERLRLGLGAVMAASFVAQLNLPVLPTVEDATFTPYSGLIISKDPGMLLFVLGGLFIVLGIGLMLYFPFCKVWVLPKAQKEGTFVAAHTSKQQALPKLK